MGGMRRFPFNRYSEWLIGRTVNLRPITPVLLIFFVFITCVGNLRKNVFLIGLLCNLLLMRKKGRAIERWLSKK